VSEVAGHPTTQRRRSERISKSLPVIVRGIDLLGQPFEERTSTLALNLHGCRYASRHHLPKNTWVTLEVPQGARRRHVRARVAWIQRPHSVREFFQIAVELESPDNIWNFSSPPADWTAEDSSAYASAQSVPEPETPTAAPERISGEANYREPFGPTMTNEYSEPSIVASSSTENVAPAENPLLHQWSAEIERQANAAAEAAAARATEQIQRAIDEFSRFEDAARDNFSTQAAAKEHDLLSAFKNELESGFEQVRGLLQELNLSAQAFRSEREAAHETMSRMAQSRLQMEADEATRAQQRVEQPAQSHAASETDLIDWRRRLDSEMNLAQSQWNELLQSSLDNGLGRIVDQLSSRSQDLLTSTDQKMTERFAELRQPLSQMYAEARETLSSLRSELEGELGRARSSLTDIEHATTRMKEYSAQLESANHDTLNELHRRLENILQAQTDEMSRRAEQILSNVPQRVSPSLEALGQQVAERTVAEIESRITPRLDHASELLRNLSSREAQADEILRLQRERLRQVSEINVREAAAQSAAVLSSVRDDFEAARKEALAKWNEELDASAVRASHSAAESISRSSEWFQQEARERLQVLVEQTIASAAGTFEEKTAEATRHLEARLEEQTAGSVAKIHQDLDHVAAEIAGRTRSQLDEAAEAAANSFGQVLRRVSEQEVETFTATSRAALAERERELGSAAVQLLQSLESSAQATSDQFRAQMASHLDSSIAEGRSAVAAEFASALNAHRAERESHQRTWSDELQRLSDDAIGKHQDRLQGASDSWVVSSVRRLNEHGQGTLESMMRSADQSLRDSFVRLFDGISQMLRERPLASFPSDFPPPSPHSDEPSHSEFVSGANA
jgi:hypothetical protein